MTSSPYLQTTSAPGGGCVGAVGASLGDTTRGGAGSGAVRLFSWGGGVPGAPAGAGPIGVPGGTVTLSEDQSAAYAAGCSGGYRSYMTTSEGGGGGSRQKQRMADPTQNGQDGAD